MVLSWITRDWCAAVAASHCTQRTHKGAICIVNAFGGERGADTSRRDLRYWLLLAVRILLLVLLALAFAQPIFKSTSALNAKTAQLHAIVLDTSLSMQHDARWTQATEQATTILDNLKSDERALVVAASGRKIALLGGPVLARDAGQLRSAIASVKPGLEQLGFTAC